MPSYYEALPICKVAMDVAVRVDDVVQCFAKGHKYSLGGRLRETTLDVVMLIARCNRRAERARQIPLLCDRIEDLKLMLNPAKELLVQVGRFVEVFWNAWRLGLRLRKVGRRWTAGAPWGAAARLVERGLARGLTVAVALEDPEPCGNVKQRRLAYLFERPLDAEVKQEDLE